ncbi:hypothetical protein [Streptomyces sp. NPDC058623]|uniref:hypothetical protein n=1 Tax=Streptomyces sp. NPDC058623 TaxID=3346563 RepID=UPI0036646B2D
MRLRLVSATLVGALCVGGLSAPAFAGEPAAPDRTVTTREVAAALGEVPGLLAASDGVAVSADRDSAASASAGGATVDVPKAASGEVTLAPDAGTGFSVSLPAGASDGPGTLVAPGTVAYPSGDGSANAVQALEGGGARMLTVISVPTAATEYRYDVTVPGGGSIALTEDGGAVVRDGSGATVSQVAAPWAADANGAPVPTRFTTDGASLTQVVDHRGGGHAYPIVADPVWLVGAALAAYFVVRWALGACGLGYLSGAAQEAFFHGWVWQNVRRAGREGCVWGLLTGGAGGLARALIRR